MMSSLLSPSLLVGPYNHIVGNPFRSLHSSVMARSPSSFSTRSSLTERVSKTALMACALWSPRESYLYELPRDFLEVVCVGVEPVDGRPDIWVRVLG